MNSFNDAKPNIGVLEEMILFQYITKPFGAGILIGVNIFIDWFKIIYFKDRNKFENRQNSLEYTNANKRIKRKQYFK